MKRVIAMFGVAPMPGSGALEPALVEGTAEDDGSGSASQAARRSYL
jgi:hypothetical protein